VVGSPWDGNWVKPSLAWPGVFDARAFEYTSAALTWAMDIPSPMKRNTYFAGAVSSTEPGAFCSRDPMANTWALLRASAANSTAHLADLVIAASWLDLADGRRPFRPPG